MRHLNRYLELYCILCRHPLPRNEYNPYEYQAYTIPERKWDADVLLFFDIAPDSSTSAGRHYRGIFRVHLRENYTYEELEHHASGHYFELCRMQRDCAECARSRFRSVHYVHLHCYKLACQLFGGISLAQLNLIARLGKTTLPGIMVLQDLPVSPGGLEIGLELLASKSADAAKTGLARLMAALSERLPTELQHMIWNYSDPFLKSISACIYNLHNPYRPYLEAETSKFPPWTFHPLLGIATMERLGVNMVNILGEDTISEIGGGVKKWQHEIPIADVEIEGIQTAFGSHGLVALRVLYEDGSTSPWTGGQAMKWFRTHRSSNVKSMRMEHDGFKVVGLKFDRDMVNDSPFNNALWNRNMLGNPERTFPVVDAILLPSSKSDKRRRMVQLIPLDVLQDGVSSLTVWAGVLYTSFIHVNGDVKAQAGERWQDYRQHPITYYFRPGETVESLHVLNTGTNRRRVRHGPFIVLVTSTGRTVYFGPHWLPHDDVRLVTSFGNYKAHKVVGIVTEALFTLRCIGAALEPRGAPARAEEDLHHHLTFPKRDAPISRENLMTYEETYQSDFFTSASLADVVCLRTQKSRGRCTGLYVEHENGVIEVLGQWDPAEQTWDLYENRQGGKLDAVTFVFSDFDSMRERTVESIVVGKGLGIRRVKFVWDDTQRELAWIFNDTCDVLEYWNGSTLDVDLQAEVDALTDLREGNDITHLS